MRKGQFNYRGFLKALGVKTVSPIYGNVKLVDSDYHLDSVPGTKELPLIAVYFEYPPSSRCNFILEVDSGYVSYKDDPSGRVFRDIKRRTPHVVEELKRFAERYGAVLDLINPTL